MKPICEMVEKANMRLRLVWAMAAKLPTSKEATAKTANICCQSMAKGSKPSTNKRMVMAKAANLGAAAIIKVTAVGAPWYTSGTHMWNGTTPSLNAKPQTTKTKPKTITWCLIWPEATALKTAPNSKLPVAPYNMDKP